MLKLVQAVLTLGLVKLKLSLLMSRLGLAGSSRSMFATASPKFEAARYLFVVRRLVGFFPVQPLRSWSIRFSVGQRRVIDVAYGEVC